MATITITNVPENIVKLYGSKIKFDYNLSFQEENIDFQELDNSQITPDISQAINKAKNTPKSQLINLSKEVC